MNRPKEFDAKVMSHIPMLRGLARKLPAQRREDAVQQTVLLALDRWMDFDETGSFYKWLTFKFKQATDIRTSRKHEVEDVNGAVASRLTAPARQDTIAYANQIVRRLSYTRDGRLLVRLATGETLAGLGERRGITKERVRQLTDRARARIARASGERLAA